MQDVRVVELVWSAMRERAQSTRAEACGLDPEAIAIAASARRAVSQAAIIIGGTCEALASEAPGEARGLHARLPGWEERVP